MTSLSAEKKIGEINQRNSSITEKQIAKNDREKQKTGHNRYEDHINKMEKLKKEEEDEKVKSKEIRTQMKNKGEFQRTYHQDKLKQMKEKENEKLGPEVKEENIKEKWAKIRSDDEDNWMSLGYDENTIKILENGKGRPVNFLKEEASFILLRVSGFEFSKDKKDKEPSIKKFVFVMWLPKKTPLLTRTKMNYHKKKIGKIINFKKTVDLYLQFSGDKFETNGEAYEGMEKIIKQKLDDSVFKKVIWKFK